eukprot:5377083-Pyramimonas_sp.AAC.1
MDSLQLGWEGLDGRPRAMCAAPPSCYAFRIIDDKKSHVERKTQTLLDFCQLEWEGPDGAPIGRPEGE